MQWMTPIILKDTNRDKKIDDKGGVTVITKGMIGQFSQIRENKPNECTLYSIVAKETSQIEDHILNLFQTYFVQATSKSATTCNSFCKFGSLLTTCFI
jgi:hypothetical protein